MKYIKNFVIGKIKIIAYIAGRSIVWFSCKDAYLATLTGIACILIINEYNTVININVKSNEKN